MRAVRYHQYGLPQVLRVEEAAEPHAGAGEIRIRVQASSVNPMDIKLRVGHLAAYMPVEFPAIAGTDAAGVVDEIGEGVDGVALGQVVFGIGSATAAEAAVLGSWAPVPSTWSAEQAAAAGIVSTTAIACLDALGDLGGRTVLIDGAAGGVGSAAVQIAVARGATVIGTASEGNHEFLRSLGAVPTTYGDGLVERVRALAPASVDAAIDIVGAGSLSSLVTLVGDVERVLTINDPGADALGARMIVNDGNLSGRLAEAARLGQVGQYMPIVQETFSLDDADEAHERVQAGHTRGKVVLTV